MAAPLNSAALVNNAPLLANNAALLREHTDAGEGAGAGAEYINIRVTLLDRRDIQERTFRQRLPVRLIYLETHIMQLFRRNIRLGIEKRRGVITHLENNEELDTAINNARRRGTDLILYALPVDDPRAPARYSRPAPPAPPAPAPPAPPAPAPPAPAPPAAEPGAGHAT